MSHPLWDLDAGPLSPAQYPGASGRGLRVAVIDSGVHAGHPHVGGAVEAGVAIDASGRCLDGDTTDRLGHGTAVAAAIREKAPDAELLPVKVFDRELRATADALVAAIDWAVGDGARVINLSLGTANPDHRLVLGEALVRVAGAGVVLVAAAEHDGVVWYPGSLPLAIGVTLDWTQPRDQAHVTTAQEGSVRRLRVAASGYPRPIPGVPPERNLKGISFAVANVTGLLCLHLSHRPDAT